MASIGTVRLEIFEAQPEATVRVSYSLSATLLDAPAQQSYRELVELIGVDEGPGEDGQNEVVGEPIFDGTVTFTTDHTSFEQIHEKKVPLAVLDEDPSPFPRQDELRARVSLTPLRPRNPVRQSNTIRRGAPVIG